jgi:hypothetical protein
MIEEEASASGWGGCQMAEHLEEVRRRQSEVVRLQPWLIADPLVLEALELMSAALTELIEHHDGLHEDNVLVRVIESCEEQGRGRPSAAAPPAAQYSSGRRMVVTERSASVITQSRSGSSP